MASSTKKSKPRTTKQSSKAKSTNPPEQKLGDTPVAPWEMASPEEKQQAKPVRQALKEAVKKVDSQQKADEVIENLEAATAGKTAAEVGQEQPKKAAPAQAAAEVEQAAKTTAGTKKTENVLEQTARALASPDARQREVVSEAAQEVLNPEQQGAPPTVMNPRAREYLRQAVLKRLKPLDAIDAGLFLKAVANKMPALTNLLRGTLGNQLASPENIKALSALAAIVAVLVIILNIWFF